ncbi:FxsA family protein [Paenibacillus sp.]|uniref:FxsA family protein n=1 Tax=Paenibacillus sp. TaxID=58172 RepID=UPI002D36E2BE|nr:FxsA family protein [Paenibacillus sp.]HZG58441.1 FxsA family protein [Paenibacillus sp.]
MFRWLVALMVVVPAAEIWLLLETGQWIGFWQTFLLILLTGFVGAFLARREGRRVLEYARIELSRGTVPTSSILDGICIFAGGLLLLTPGFLTDATGFLLVFPATRTFFKGLLSRILQRGIETGRIRFFR